MKKVLVIDRDASLGARVAAALRPRAVRVRTCGDGQQALLEIRAEPPDAIVLSVELPGLSGYSVCNRLKKDAQLRSIPLVLTSAEATPETFAEHRKLRTRADEYLRKPFEDGELVSVLERLAGLPPPSGEGQRPRPGSELALEPALGFTHDPAGGSVEISLGLDDAPFERTAHVSPPGTARTRPPVPGAVVSAPPGRETLIPSAASEVGELRSDIAALSAELERVRALLTSAEERAGQAEERAARAEERLREQQDAAAAARESLLTALRRLEANRQVAPAPFEPRVPQPTASAPRTRRE